MGGDIGLILYQEAGGPAHPDGTHKGVFQPGWKALTGYT